MGVRGVDEGFLEASGGMSCQLTTGRKPDGSQRTELYAVADCGRFSCQDTQKLKRAKTLE